MIFLGQFKAGEIVPYAETFHNDQGNAEDPTSPSAKIRNADGTWSALTTPAKLDNTTGLFGGTINTTGLQPGLYLVSLRGTVTTSKTVGTVLAFRIIANTEADVMGRLGTPAGASVSADVAAVKTDTGAIKAKTDNLPASPANEATVQAVKAKTDNLPADPASNTQVNTRLAATDYIAPDNATIANIYAKVDTEVQAIIDAVAAIQSDIGDPSVEGTTILTKVKDLDKGSGTVAKKLSDMGADYLAKLNGVPLAGVTVRAYLKTDLNHIKGQITTDAAGDGTLYLVSGSTYVLFYEYQGSVMTKEYTVP